MTFSILFSLAILGQNADWPDHFDPILAESVTATNVETSSEISLQKAYLLHRDDIEKVYVLSKRLEECTRQIEKRADDDTRIDFLDTTSGRILLIGLGVVTGAGLTMGAFWLAR